MYLYSSTKVTLELSFAVSKSNLWTSYFPSGSLQSYTVLSRSINSHCFLLMNSFWLQNATQEGDGHLREWRHEKEEDQREKEREGLQQWRRVRLWAREQQETWQACCQVWSSARHCGRRCQGENSGFETQDRKDYSCCWIYLLLS